jgi:hypothetical protein
MANLDLEAIDSPVQKTHEWLGAIAETPHLSNGRHAVLVGQVLIKSAVAAIPVVIIVALSALVIAAFVGGYVAALQ